MNFKESAQICAERIAAWLPLIQNAPEPSGPSLGVLITPWMQTAVPWLSVEIALFCRSQGVPVVIFYDDASLDFNDYEDRAWEGPLIRGVIARCEEFLPVIDVAAAAPAAGAGLGPAQLDTLIFEAGVHRFYGEDPSENHLLTHPGISQLYQAHFPRVATVVEKVDRLFLPGGFYGVSCLYTIAARSRGIKLTTYDCTMRGLWYCLDGVAAWSDTLPPAFHEMRNGVESADLDVMRRHCEEVLEKRMTGNDYYQLQVKVAGAENPEVDVLICLNWRPDTAAILRQKLFPDVRTWLRRVGRWAVLNKKQLVIRRHPAERLEGYFVNDDVERQIRDLDPKGRFIKVVGPEDPVNTYDLLRNAKVLLPYTSQVGIEGIFLGIPTVLCAECFQAECGFSWEADSQDEYFRLIASACRGELTVTDEQKELAALCYFIFQHGLEIVTEFRPLVECFEMWSKLSPAELWEHDWTAPVRKILLRPEKLLAVELTREALEALRIAGPAPSMPEVPA